MFQFKILDDFQLCFLQAKRIDIDRLSVSVDHNNDLFNGFRAIRYLL